MDQLLRSGDVSQARELLKELCLSKLPRFHCVGFANLARRMGEPETAVEILAPIVRAQAKLIKPATPLEITAYAAALSRIGAIGEAIGLLREILEKRPASERPAEAYLQLSFAQIYLWDYKAAIPNLKVYLESAVAGAYEKSVARLNLAAAERFAHFETGGREELLAQQVLAEAAENRWVRLEQSALELLAQIYIARGAWTRALKMFERGEKISIEMRHNSFNLAKWRVFYGLIKDGPVEEHLRDLSELRKEAVKTRNWEAVRECDCYRAIATRDQAAISKVYFGTPFQSYRKKIEIDSRAWMSIPATYIWNFDHGLGPSEAKRPERTLDLATFTFGDRKLEHPGRLLHRLLLILLSDFYRPFQLGTLFARLYPDEFYDPSQSLRRVHMAIKRLRSWIKENGLPLMIQVEDGAVSLRAEAPPEAFGVLTRLERVEFSEKEIPDKTYRLAKLREVWPYKAFSTQQAAKALGFSQRQAREFLSWAETEGALVRTGQSRATCYYFPEKKAARNAA